jgi:hypothetical protein
MVDSVERAEMAVKQRNYQEALEAYNEVTWALG